MKDKAFQHTGWSQQSVRKNLSQVRAQFFSIVDNLQQYEGIDNIKMDTYISLGNTKNDLKAISDPTKRAFVQHLVKLFNPKLSEYCKMLRESSGNLANLDKQSTQKQSFLTQTISRFHYVQKSAFTFDKDIYSKKIIQDSFDTLAKYVQFNFAYKIAGEISQKIMQFFKMTEPAVQETDQKHLVLGTAGTLLEVGYKVVYVQLDESTKWKYYASFSTGPLKKRNQKNQIHFAAILFSVSIVHNPPSKEEEAIVSGQHFDFTKKQLNFIETKQKLMKFVELKRSNDLFLAFDKFQLLQFGKFRDYYSKYLTKQALKVGYFDSMQSYISGSNSIFANGDGKSMSLSSNSLEIYNSIVLPAINILTPINAQMLPDFLDQIAKKPSQKQKRLLEQPQGSEQVTILNNQLPNKRDKQPGYQQQIAVQIEQKIELLQKNFHMQVTMQGKDESYQLQGVMIDQLIKSVQNRVGQVQVHRLQEGGLFSIQFYTGMLYDSQTVVSLFSMQNVSRVRFYLKKNVSQIDIDHNKTTGRILKISQKIEIEAKEYSFSLNFMQDYPSQFCFYEQLVNKNLYMAGIQSKSRGNTTQNVQIQVSKAVSLYRKEFFQLFQKKLGFQGAPIFFVDETRKQCKIIAICKDQNNFGSLFRRKNQEIIKNPVEQKRSLLDFSTKFLKKEAYAQVITKEKPQAEQRYYQLIDKNEKGEPLREQLLKKSIQGSSPIQIIGIFKMASRSQKKFGIAIMCMNNYFIASASSVLFDGSGYIHLIKSYTEDKQHIQDFQGFDLEECCQYAHLEIMNILMIPSNQEYVYLEVKESDIKKLKTERKMNINSLECLLDSRETGGFFLQIDFKNTFQTNFVSFHFLQITKKFSIVLAQIQKQYPNRQGIMFAYQKGNPKIQYFLGLYSPKSPLGCFPFPKTYQNDRLVEQKLVITVDQNEEVIRLQKIQQVVEKQQYQAIGYFKYKSQPFGFGTGVLISTDISTSHQKVNKILTCAHNFYGIFGRDVDDDRNNLSSITFCYYKRSLIQFCELSIKKVIIHPTYEEIINRSISQLAQEQFTSLHLSPAYDIAIVLLEEPVCLERPFYLELPFGMSESLATQLQAFMKNQILTKSFIAQIEVAGFPEEQESLGIVQGKMYKENVQSHQGEDFPKEYPLFYMNVVPLVQTTHQPLVIDHKLSTLPGQSGSPIFNKITRKVVGVHAGSLRDQSIQNRLQTFSNLGSFVYTPSVYQFLSKITIDQP